MTEQNNTELIEYISEMLKLISSGKDDIDNHHIDLVAENIHAKALIMHSEFMSFLKASLKEVNQ